MIKDYQRPPHNGKAPTYTVVFFHGYGSSGALMHDYAGNLLAPLLPEAELRFADAPIQMGWDHHSWFELRDVVDAKIGTEHLSQIVSQRAISAAKDVNAYIDHLIKEEGIPENRIILAGFSQGATMAFYAAMMRDKPLAGVFSLSGGALDRVPHIHTTLPVCLVAGELEQQDYSGAPHVQKAFDFLRSLNVLVQSTIVADQGHDISPKSMEIFRDFVSQIVSPSLNMPAGMLNRKTEYKPPSIGM